MLRKWTIFLLIAAVVLPLLAQQADALDDEDLSEGIVKINYEKKSVATAALLSSLFPGAGQFYANPRAVTTYIFPILEVGMWVGYFTFQGKGEDKEDKYMDYADEHYNRDYQIEVQNLLMGIADNDIYDSSHFRLDDTNTQHFYEDIGKYDKYIFGWDDWYATYVTNAGGVPLFAMDDGANIGSTADDIWMGNYPDSTAMNEHHYDTPYSPMRAEYDVMRRDAEKEYDKADYFTFGLILNHIVAAIDAIRVTRAYNIDYISKRPPVEVDVQTCMRSGQLTPMLTLSHRF